MKAPSNLRRSTRAVCEIDPIDALSGSQSHYLEDVTTGRTVVKDAGVLPHAANATNCRVADFLTCADGRHQLRILVLPRGNRLF